MVFLLTFETRSQLDCAFCAVLPETSLVCLFNPLRLSIVRAHKPAALSHFYHDLAHYGISRAKDWVSVDCGTMSNAIFFLYILDVSICYLKSVYM